MCGRFYVEADDPEIIAIVNTIGGGTKISVGEVFPTNTAAGIAPNGEAAAMRWGFPRFDGKGEVINARSETAAQKNMFRRALMEGRCLIPSSWYFEWEKRRSEKIKYALASRDAGLTWLAGISRVDPETGERNFVILTRPVWDGIAFIHDRMPVILPSTLHDEWLNGHDPERTMERSAHEVVYKLA